MNKERYTKMLKMQKSIQVEHEKASKYLYVDATLSQNYDWLLKKRLYEEQPTLRSFFTFTAFQYLESDYSLDLKEPESRFFKEQLPYITEVLINIQYYHNHALDFKYDVQGLEDIQMRMIWANRLRSFLDRYIEYSIPEQYISALRLMLNKVYDAVDIGQQMERRCCLYKHWDNQNIAKDFYKSYVQSRVDSVCLETAMDVSMDEVEERKHLFLLEFPPSSRQL